MGTSVVYRKAAVYANPSCGVAAWRLGGLRLHLILFRFAALARVLRLRALLATLLPRTILYVAGCSTVEIMMPARVKAFLLHIALSSVIAVCVLLLVFGLWYPAPLHTAVGVTHIFLLLLAVDLILGPLLTLLVYNPGKKTLVLDLSIIVFLQISALGYGLWTVAEGRPAWLVYNVDRVDLVRVLDIDPRKLDRAQPEYRSPSWFGPRWVSAVLPSDNAERNELMFEAVSGGSDLPQHPSFYRSFSDARAAIQSRSRPLAELQGFNPAERVQAVTEQWPEASGWLPLMADTPMVVLLYKESVQVLAIVDLRPWL